MNRLNRITRSLAAIGTGIALAFGGIVGTTPAVANTRSPNFVTRAEYQRVDKGMKMERVHRIFFRGSKVSRRGRQIWAGREQGRPAQQRQYRVKNTRAWEQYAAKNHITEPGPGVYITYHKVNGVWRVASHGATWNWKR